MKKYTLLGNVFELEPAAHTILTDYVNRLEKNAKKLGIADIILENITYKLIDKLHKAKSHPISEEEIVDITDSIGDPDEVFITDDKKSRTQDRKGFDFKGVIDKHLGSDKPMIWGVCLWVAESLHVPVSLVRLATVVLVFLLGASIWIYPLGAIILHYKDQLGLGGKQPERKPKTK